MRPRTRRSSSTRAAPGRPRTGSSSTRRPARSGFRQNEVEQLADRLARRRHATAATAATTTCDPSGSTALRGQPRRRRDGRVRAVRRPVHSAGRTRSRSTTDAGEDVATNDIVLKLYLRSSRAERPRRELRTRSTARRRSTTSRRAACRRASTTCRSARSRRARPTTPRRTRTTASIAINTAAGTRPLATTPKWKVLPQANPPLDYSTTDTRVIDVLARPLDDLTPPTPTARSRSRTSRRARPWDFDVQAHQPTFTTDGQQRRDTAEALASPLDSRAARGSAGSRRPQRTSTRGRTRGTRASATRPSSRPAATTSTPRSRTCSSATTGCTTSRTSSASPRTNYNLQHDNFGNTAPGPYPAAARATRSSATSRPAPSRGGAPIVRGPRQRQPDHAQRRHPADHQPVPVPADRRRVLLARASTATSTRRCSATSTRTRSPTAWSAGPTPGLTGAPGRRDGRELVGPRRARVPARVRLRARRTARTRGRVGAVRRPATRRSASATTRSTTTRSTTATSASTSPGPGGARRRRDLERGQLRHPPGAGRASTTARSRRPTRALAEALRRRRRCRRRRSARATGAGSRSCSTLAADASRASACSTRATPTSPPT